MVTADEARAVLETVVDPEIPALTIADIGILRGVAVDAAGTVVVTITPTYSGCPALDVIKADVAAALTAAGCADHEIQTVLAPAWTTDWMTPQAKEKLRRSGIAPPARAGENPEDEVDCPQCGSSSTRVVSAFGSVACQSLWVCASCGEPFPHFKAI